MYLLLALTLFGGIGLGAIALDVLAWLFPWVTFAGMTASYVWWGYAIAFGSFHVFVVRPHGLALVIGNAVGSTVASLHVTQAYYEIERAAPFSLAVGVTCGFLTFFISRYER